MVVAVVNGVRAREDVGFQLEGRFVSRIFFKKILLKIVVKKINTKIMRLLITEFIFSKDKSSLLERLNMCEK